MYQFKRLLLPKFWMKSRVWMLSIKFQFKNVYGLILFCRHKKPRVKLMTHKHKKETGNTCSWWNSILGGRRQRWEEVEDDNEAFFSWIHWTWMRNLLRYVVSFSLGLWTNDYWRKLMCRVMKRITWVYWSVLKVIDVWNTSAWDTYLKLFFPFIVFFVSLLINKRPMLLITKNLSFFFF